MNILLSKLSYSRIGPKMHLHLLLDKVSNLFLVDLGRACEAGALRVELGVLDDSAGRGPTRPHQ